MICHSQLLEDIWIRMNMERASAHINVLKYASLILMCACVCVRAGVCVSLCMYMYVCMKAC